jgi:hypothetical protein
MASLLLIRCLNDDVASALYTIQDARTRGEWVGDVAVDSLSVYNNEALRRFRVQMVSTAQTGWDLVIRIDAGCSILRPLEPLKRLAPTAERVYGEGDFLRVSLSLEDTATASESIPLCAVSEQEGESPYDYIVLQSPRHKTLARYFQEATRTSDTMTGGWATIYYGLFSDMITRYGYKKVAEVGIGYGGHAKRILRGDDIDHLFLVDPMVFFPNDNFCVDILANVSSGDHFDEMAALIRWELEPWSHKYTWIRKPSLEISNDEIPDDSLDAVFVDGDHSYESVLADLKFWYRKIRVGGRMMGDDYWIDGVARAVHDFATENGYDIEFISTRNPYPLFCFLKS